MTPEEMLDDVLSSLSDASSPDEAWAIMQDISRDVIRVPDMGGALVARVLSYADPDERAAQRAFVALTALLTEARMDRDNNVGAGRVFLDELENALSQALAVGEDDYSSAESSDIMAIARCYSQAGLPTPGALTAAMNAFNAELMASFDGTVPDIDAMLDTLREEAQGDAFGLHTDLSEMLAAFEPVIRAPVIMAVIDRGEALYDRVGCYWLLDPELPVRQAAVTAYAARMQAGRLDAALASAFVTLRPWLPEDDARKALDAVIREAMRSEVTGGAAPVVWKHHRIITSVPDGVGAQSVAVAVQTGGRRAVAMILIKQDVGIADAYLIPCSSATEQRRFVEGVSEQIEMFDVPLDFIKTVVAAGLAEGIETGTPPASGMLDVVAVLGFEDLRPAALSISGWIDTIDPDATIAALSPQKRGRLVNAAGEWGEASGTWQGWFEDNADIQDELAHAITRASQEKAVWRYLETRRLRWAKLIARTAAVLHADQDKSGDDWRPLAATALALTEGRPLPKTPLMRSVFEQTLDVIGNPWGDFQRSARSLAEPPVLEIETSMVDPATVALPDPEKRGELAKILKVNAASMPVDWISGYLAAIVLAPSMISPTDWMGAMVAAGGDFRDDAQMQRYLDIVVLRYHAFNDAAMDAKSVTALIKVLKAGPFENWCAGFTDAVDDYRREWRGRSLKKDDKAILKMVDDMAEGKGKADTLRLALPSWIVERRYGRR